MTYDDKNERIETKTVREVKHWLQAHHDEVDFFQHQGQSRQFRKRQYVYHAGTEPEFIYFIQKGLVGLTLTTTQGNEYLVRLYRQGDVFGHRSFLAREPYHASAQALEATMIKAIPGGKWRDWMLQKPDRSMRVFEKLARELGEAEQFRGQYLGSNVLGRVRDAVEYFETLEPNRNWTRREIAQFIGSTTPTVIRALQKIQR